MGELDLDKIRNELNYGARGIYGIGLHRAAENLYDEVKRLRDELTATRNNRLISAIFGHHKGAPRPFALYRTGEVRESGLVALGAEFPDGAVALRLANDGGWTTKSEGGAEGITPSYATIVWLSDELEPLAEMEQERDEARAALATATGERDAARRERDRAIAHDRQPYPTQWAYDQACKALHRHRGRADRLAAFLREEVLNRIERFHSDEGTECLDPMHREICAEAADLLDDDARERDNPPDLTNPERAALEALRLYRKGFTAYFLSVLGPNRGPGTLAHLIAAVDALESGLDPSLVIEPSPAAPSSPDTAGEPARGTGSGA